jgi:glycosyltransferase involved in cell wall biosynthesis
MLSIIIPTLNEERYLPALLDSIKSQDFKDYEIIVADNNSTDKTREIAKSFGCRIIAGGLPAKGRNEGAKVAKKNLLLFLDADVILPERFLGEFLKKFEEKKLDISSTAIEAANGKTVYKLGSKLWNLYFKANQYFSPCAGGFCILVKKEIHQKLGGFDEEIKVAEDFVYARKAKKIGKFHFFNSPHFLISTRRFESEGMVRAFLKYLLIGFHAAFLGPIKSDIFKYKFGHYSKIKK